MTTALRLPEDLKRRALAYSVRTGISVNALACQGIALFLDTVERSPEPPAAFLRPLEAPAALVRRAGAAIEPPEPPAAVLGPTERPGDHPRLLGHGPGKRPKSKRRR